METLGLERIRLPETMQAAADVLEWIDSLATPSMAGRMWLGSFSNGREQGFCLTTDCAEIHPSRKASFAGHKGSDGIAVYLGTSDQFGYGTNQPTEEAWDDCTHGFDRIEASMAACAIIEHLFGKPLELK